MSAKSKTSIWSSPLLWIALLVGGAAIAAILLASRENEPVSVALETSSVQVAGAALPPLAEPDPAIGLAAPTVMATTLDGDRVEVGGSGQPRVMGFFAHWCSHCQAEAPRLVEWLKAGDLPPSVEVLAVSTSVTEGADNYPPSAWFARIGWTETVLLDSLEGDFATSYGLTSFPYWVAVDAQGEVVARTSGEIGEVAFRQLVDAAAGR